MAAYFRIVVGWDVPVVVREQRERFTHRRFEVEGVKHCTPGWHAKACEVKHVCRIAIEAIGAVAATREGTAATYPTAVYAQSGPRHVAAAVLVAAISWQLRTLRRDIVRRVILLPPGK